MLLWPLPPGRHTLPRSESTWFSQGLEFVGAQTVWISQQLHFPIKTVQQDGTTVEFSNIKKGPEDAKLFGIPSDYRKFDPMGLAGQHEQK